jgi:anti-sigma-K factor RskA
MPDPALQTTALRYAAGDLPPAEAAAFEARLATDQDARDALSEAVRLSAAALGQAPPAPDPTFRAAIRERLSGWPPGWLARRAYRGHPLAWAGLGAAAAAACTVVGLSLADRMADPQPDAAPPVVTAPRAATTPEPVAVAPTPREAEPVASAGVDADADAVTERGTPGSATEATEPAEDDLKDRPRAADGGPPGSARTAADGPEPKEP